MTVERNRTPGLLNFPTLRCPVLLSGAGNKSLQGTEDSRLVDNPCLYLCLK